MSTEDRGPPLRSAAVRAAFLERYLADRLEGRSVALVEYQAQFVGFEDQVADEYERVLRPADSGAEDRAGERVGAYRLVRLLGRGGQGMVYLAEDTRLKRPVALKILMQQMLETGDRWRRFRREVEIASRLDHPSLCAVYEADVVDGAAYVAMRFIHGKTLAARLAEERAQPARAFTRAEILERVQLMEKVARAIHVAHEAGVVHRDLKPANIMVQEDGTPVILDFGLARQLDSEDPTLTRTGDVFGTPAYLSPEQLQDTHRELDRGSDIHALGVTLYELVTKELPFRGATRHALFQSILTQIPVDARRHQSAIPKDLVTVLGVALEKNPDRRYATALALAEDLKCIAESRPISAVPPSPFGRLVRWVERDRARAGLTFAAGFLLLALAGLAGYFVAMRPLLLEVVRLERRQEWERLAARAFAMSEESSVRKVDRMREFVAEDPSLKLLRIAIGIGLLESGDAQGVLVELEKFPPLATEVRALRRIEAEAKRMLGQEQESQRILQELGEPVDAEEEFATGWILLLRYSKGDRTALAQALPHLDQAVLQHDVAEHLMHLIRLRALMHSNDTLPFMKAARAMKDLWPHSAASHFWWGTALRIHENDRERATEEWRKAVEIDPDFVQAWMSLALVLRELGEVQESMRAYESSIQAVNSFSPSFTWKQHFLYGNSLWVMGHFQEAIEPLRRALQLNPADAPSNLALIKCLMLAHESQEAEERLQRILQREPENRDASRLLFEVMNQTGRIDDAVVELERRLDLVPEDPGAWLLLALLRESEGDVEGAQAAAEFAAEHRAELKAEDPKLEQRLRQLEERWKD